MTGQQRKNALPWQRTRTQQWVDGQTVKNSKNIPDDFANEFKSM
jgi:hypothetical protein